MKYSTNQEEEFRVAMGISDTPTPTPPPDDTPIREISCIRHQRARSKIVSGIVSIKPDSR